MDGGSGSKSRRFEISALIRSRRILLAPFVDFVGSNLRNRETCLGFIVINERIMKVALKYVLEYSISSFDFWFSRVGTTIVTPILSP